MTEDELIYGDDDIVQLEALIQSPAFAALKRVVARYRDKCQGILLTSSDTHQLYQTQGRIIGVNVIESLPALLVKRRQLRLREKDKIAKLKKQGARPKPDLS